MEVLCGAHYVIMQITWNVVSLAHCQNRRSAYAYM